MLIDVRIVCAHDALETAQNLERLLSAEGHQVEVCCGSACPSSKASPRREAVLILWSARAQAAHYPRQWALATQPARLVELAFCKDYPPIDRREPIIDFASWKGLRGGPAWRHLQERLRAIANTLEPPKAQPHAAALVLVGVSLVAAGAAVWARMDAERAPLNAHASETAMAAPLDTAPTIDGAAQGGPLTTSEPESYSPEIDMQPYIVRPLRPHAHLLPAARIAPPVQFQEPNLIERLLRRERNPPPESERR